MIHKILIANRGEIACRIIKTCQKMGIEAVAVFSEADKNAKFVELADSAYYLGPSPASESYLCIDNIIQIAQKAQVDAIHPGYGFLSENALFAKACQEANIIFIGPSPKTIEQMGSKSDAKNLLADTRIPMIPGYHGKHQEADHLLEEAKKIGFPVLLKPSGGGGGKGMQIVDKAEDFLTALTKCKREAKASFADETVLIEKYLKNPRHIEIQIFADKHGNVVHLFERDCSIQRRHQKIIEEALAPALNKKLREDISEAAILIAKAVNYVGAGTVEFLVDEEQHFYFMEMNTRLQVEHPVTEMVTGFDLVEWQINTAKGNSLPKKQSEISANGHAIEVRICAEDPLNHFAPSIGKIIHLQEPSLSSEIRIDTGVRENDVITPFYDSMISKLIVWAEDRSAAIKKMMHALAQYHLVGVKTNIDYLQMLLQTDDFKNGKLNTHFVEKHQTALLQKLRRTNANPISLIIAALYLFHQKKSGSMTPWDEKNSFRLNLPWAQTFLFNDNQYITIEENHIIYQNKSYYVDELVATDRQIKVLIDGEKVIAEVIPENNALHIFTQGDHELIQLPNRHDKQTDEMIGHLTAPMPGTVIAVSAARGAKVEIGDPLIVLEAMKMEHTLVAPFAGVVQEIKFKVGELVNEGTELIVLEPME